MQDTEIFKPSVENSGEISNKREQESADSKTKTIGKNSNKKNSSYSTKKERERAALAQRMAWRERNKERYNAYTREYLKKRRDYCKLGAIYEAVVW
nr:hypothetical protein [Marseillevirus cajuinensis]